MLNNYKRSSNDYFIQQAYKKEFIKKRKDKHRKIYWREDIICQYGFSNEKHSSKPLEQRLHPTNMWSR